MGNPDQPCFHCGEPVPGDTDFELVLDGTPRQMCCAGCLAVAGLIRDSGYERYYRFRQSLSRRAGDDVTRLTRAWESVDHNQKLWGLHDSAGQYDLLLQTEGIVCAACAWLIRIELGKLNAVDEVQVDVSSGFTRIHWRPSAGRLSEIAVSLLGLGYKPHLPLAEEEERARRAERSASLKRLGVAGLGMMQVMMYAVGLYAGDAQGIGISSQRFLEWVSLLVTTPVLLYSGRVFIEGAIAGLRSGRPGMDVPVALAIVGAYTASCYNFFTGQGAVWFDSVVMFIFFLSLGRHVEMGLRHRNQQAGSVLAKLLPEWAERLTDHGSDTVLAEELETGHRVRVQSGEAFPADGFIAEGKTEVDEALLTGESLAIAKNCGEPVIAGSMNLGQPVVMEVTTSGEASTISHLGHLLQRARTSRSPAAESAERFAGMFVLGVLLLAALSFGWWYFADRSQALGITLSVLVVSCPCAFSLAAPAVTAAASRALLRHGIILTRGSALESLAAVRTAIFDKTGTLTTGDTVIAAVTLNRERSGFDQDGVLKMAASLEQYSSHPLSRAFRVDGPLIPCELVESSPGNGISGLINGRSCRIGQKRYAVENKAGLDMAVTEGIWLADERGWIARFEISDEIKSGSKSLVDQLKEDGISVSLISGDGEPAVARVARQLGIDTWFSRQDPKMKLERLDQLAADDGTVLMVGDGVNDAPVLAAADVSIAVHGGTELANAAADLILTGPSMRLVWEARSLAVKAAGIIRQNLFWAAAYNLTMIPLAISGSLKPWMAALGMSLSSLLVVANAARIGRHGAAKKSRSTAGAMGTTST